MYYFYTVNYFKNIAGLMLTMLLVMTSVCAMPAEQGEQDNEDNSKRHQTHYKEKKQTSKDKKDCERNYMLYSGADNFKVLIHHSPILYRRGDTQVEKEEMAYNNELYTIDYISFCWKPPQSSI